MSHRCHALGCNKEIPPKLLMCLRHWRMVPERLQAEIWRTYRPGQEIDKMPSEAYMEAQRAAISAVAEREAAASRQPGQ
jgi:hypothetical protein